MCFLVHESTLFFPLSFLKLSSWKGKPEFSCGAGLAKLPSRAGPAGTRRPLQPTSTARPPAACRSALALGEKMRKEPEAILPPTEKGLCKPTTPPERGSFVERPKGGFLCSLLLPSRQRITARVPAGTPHAQEVHHGCSPTARLPPEHLTVKQRMKTQVKDERGKLSTVKSNDTNSFFPSFIQKNKKVGSKLQTE